ncbi:unnamed protein product [Moneuplotes crassus]|uniref:Uncharacterized protein n=1 Tax=Euplotes crassus TaxID=5936 RepID=A0AAD1XHT7_EUPCR|nr:unnamed protein product [Moneuplotes crassus]
MRRQQIDIQNKTILILKKMTRVQDMTAFLLPNVSLTKKRQMIQDWNSFGIINSCLLESVWAKKVLQGQILPDLDCFKREKISTQDHFEGTKIKTKPECNSSCEGPTKSTIVNSSREKIQELKEKIFKVTKTPQILKRLNQRKLKQRSDSKIKSALRFIKRFIKKFFKTMNSQIIERRYVNCSPIKIFETMRSTLSNIVSEELLVDDLVYFTIGILKIKKPFQLDCKQTIRKEISDFIEMSANFTYKKMQRALQSNYLRVLCRSILPQVDRSIAETLEQVLNFE